MVYKVTEKLVYKNKVFLPGQLIKLSEEELKKYADKVAKLSIHTK